MPNAEDRIKPGDLARIVEDLESGEAEERCRALRMLCPCRNRVYDTEVWLKVLEARESDLPLVRDGAEHAIGTLLQRAMSDPRSAELLQRLGGALGDDVGASLMSISLWGPRNRPSRRKRMTPCKTGALKALASVQHFS